MTRARPSQPKSAGFTLLEVMVSMAILAVSLSAVFSTEAGAVRMAARARKIGYATLLARCKMGEIEEKVAKEGLPVALTQEVDECCIDGPIEGFSCAWEIEPILMPETMFAPADENENGSGAPGTGTTSGTGTDPTAAAAAAAAAAASATGATTSPPGGSNTAAGQSTMLGASQAESMLSNPSALMSGNGDMGGIASMAMQFVYPVLKPSFENQIRRATVTVSWKEGSATRSFDVTQYLVAEQAVVPGMQDAADGVTPGAGQTGTPGAPGQPGQTQPLGSPGQFGQPGGLPGGLFGGARP